MYPNATDLARLVLLIQRLLDADALLTEDGVALQEELAAAYRSLAEGDQEVAREHIAGLVCFTEALVHTDALDPTDGLAVIETARPLLAEDAE